MGSAISKSIASAKAILRYALLLLTVVAVAPAFSVVSSDSARLEALRLSVEKDHDPDVERRYLDSFPSDYQTFRRMFMGNNDDFDELMDRTEAHLSLLESLSHRYPDKVLNIWLGVAKNGHWDADAVAMVQDQLARYAASHTREFASALVEMPSEDRTNVIRFIADVESYGAYPEYPEIMEHLHRLGYDELQRQFAEAERARKIQRDH